MVSILSKNVEPPSAESSAALRKLIHAKRKNGQVAEALVLTQLGARIARHEHVADSSDEMSRMALVRYLELMPDDAEVRQLLDQLTPESVPISSRPNVRRQLLWALFITCGISAAGTIHLNGLPMLNDPPLPPAPVVRVKLPPVIQVPVAAKEPEISTPIVIRAVGDVVLGSNFPRYRLPGKNDKERIASLRHELKSADIVLGNLEGVLSDKGMARKDISKRGLYAFRMPESYAATLHEMGFDVMSLANNHSMDFGEEGLKSTIDALKAEGVQPMGVPGAEMAIVKVRNTFVAFLNYSYLSAFVQLGDEQRISDDIKRARAAADLVVVTVHGGKEGVRAIGAPSGDEYYMNEYRGDILKFAHLAIDSGASAVFGHGPHVVRPYEVYKDKPIFFSLGNFVGYRTLSTRGKLANSIIAEVRFSPKGKLLGAGVIPLKLDRSGIPSVDYSAASLNTLDGLLDERLEKNPVLEIAMRSALEKTSMQPVAEKNIPPLPRP
jgi:poly-gamma-glutamate capsule biosynthesis protein CapA/YwtB (metallophosphatase superfamily)